MSSFAAFSAIIWVAPLMVLKLTPRTPNTAQDTHIKK